MRTKTLYLTIILSIISQFAWAGILNTNSQDFTLRLRNGNYTTTENFQEFKAEFAALAVKEQQESLFRIVQFKEIPNRVSRELLSENGIHLHDYLPSMAYYAEIKPDANINLLSGLHVRSVIEITPEFKLDFALLTADYPEHALRDNNRIEVFVHYFSSVNAAELLSAMNRRGILLVEQSHFDGSMLVNTPLDQINWLAMLPTVIFIESIHIPAEPDNYTAKTQHRSTNIDSNHPLGRKYDGTGVNIMLQDDGVIGPHIDYQGRIGAQFMTHNWGDHGDHIAGTLVGAGNIEPKARGMAPGATLFVYAASQYQGFNLIPSHYDAYTIRVTSTSYSNGCNAGYNSLARTMDQQVRNFPALMHVFSAGNAGGDDCGYGAGSGWGNITGGHKAGKNVIAVGNLSATDGLAGSSSRGPAYDGRLKPEVTAKGSNVYSTTDPNRYTTKSGTSMACPGVAGTLAQLYQAYHINNNNEDPLGGLMKAIIMNSADDLGNPGPDFRFGFGRINGLRAALTIEEKRYDTASIEQAEVISHFLEVPEDLHELRIMLYWTDFEASTAAAQALINDLDLLVVTPEGDTLMPWILDHTPVPALLNAPATRGVDSINNVEQVTLALPTAGVYEIIVNGRLIPQGPQHYFITWELLEPTLAISYPAGGESFVPGETELIRWDATGTDEPFDLEYSTDGVNWMPIVANLTGNERNFSWTVPYAVTGNAWVRISRSGEIVTSEHPFSIIGLPQNLRIDWACPDAFRFAWDEVYGADYYIVRMLGEREMDSVATTHQTSYIFSGVGTAASWVSVQAVGPNGTVGRRADAIMKESGTFKCNESDLWLRSVPGLDWTVYHNTHDLSQMEIQIEVYNNGIDEVYALHVGFNVDGLGGITEPALIFIQPDSSYIHTFSATADFSEPGEYIINTWVYAEADQIRANDTIAKRIRVLDIPVVQPFPWYIQSFEEFERCMPFPTCELYSCELAEGWVNLINNTEDQIDWRTFSGPTPTGNTGPPHDKTLGTNEGKYLYIEPSVFCTYREAKMLTPSFDLTNAESAVLTFWYHMHGTGMGRLHIDAFANNNTYLDIIPALVGNQANEWRQAEVPVDQFLGSVVTFRFRGFTGFDQLSDVAIDDFEITTTVGTTNLLQPSWVFDVYPNPGEGIFNIRLSDASSGNMKLSIKDMTGRIVYARQLTHSAPHSLHTINLKHLRDGVYIIQIEGNGSQVRKKLLKQ